MRSDINIRVVDKVLLSGVLQTGEYVLGDAGFGALHLPTEPDNALYFPYGNEIISVVENVRVMYIKPASWSPVQRIEFSADLSKVEINNLAKTIMELFISPTITEPYPLFITDRICKAISNPADAVLASLLNRLTKEDLKEMGYSDEDLQWILRPYRTEV